MAYCAIYTVSYAIYYFYFYFYIEQTLSEFSYCPGKKTNKQTKKNLIVGPVCVRMSYLLEFSIKNK